MQGIIICFDLTRIETFNSIEGRVRDIKSKCGADAILMLVGTKCDLWDKRAVLREVAEELADEHEMLYCETSAKFNINVRSTFEQIID